MAFLLQMALQCAVAFVATWAFAALFSVPPRQYLFCGLTGAAGWACYLAVMQMQPSAPFASVAAALVLALMARVFAARRCCPVTVFLMNGIFPLVPGAGIYWAAYYAITKQAA
ncbi:MAG: threonine/serine exporter family protein, partial [Ruthenibacterium sp.]